MCGNETFSLASRYTKIHFLFNFLQINQIPVQLQVTLNSSTVRFNLQITINSVTVQSSLCISLANCIVKYLKLMHVHSIKFAISMQTLQQIWHVKSQGIINSGASPNTNKNFIKLLSVIKLLRQSVPTSTSCFSAS